MLRLVNPWQFQKPVRNSYVYIESTYVLFRHILTHFKHSVISVILVRLVCTAMSSHLAFIICNNANSVGMFVKNYSATNDITIWSFGIFVGFLFGSVMNPLHVIHICPRFGWDYDFFERKTVNIWHVLILEPKCFVLMSNQRRRKLDSNNGGVYLKYWKVPTHCRYTIDTKNTVINCTYGYHYW